MRLLPLLATSIASSSISRAPGLPIAKLVAALVFLGVVMAIGIAYRSLRRRLELEDATQLIEEEFARMDADAANSRTSPASHE